MRALRDAPSSQPPDRVALVHEESHLTFGDLAGRSAAWARTLVARGVRPDDLVAFGFENGPEFLDLAFGGYRAEATAAPISHRLPAFEHEAILHLADRRTGQIISGGVKIRPAEVEAALLRHLQVRSCAGYGEADALP